MASSYLTVGSGDRHVMALHGWFGSARGWGPLPDYLEHDPALSAQVMEQTYLALLPNAELEVLANAGHYPMFETPVALATALEEFLGRE